MFSPHAPPTFLNPIRQLKGRHCIGLVAYVGQNQDDFSDYSQSGIGKSNCQGYVILLTDTFSEPFLVENEDKKIALPWGSESVKDEIFTNPLKTNNDWSGYYNQQEIKKYAKKEGLSLLDFPAAYTCENYDKYTVIKHDNGEIEILDTATGLEAPDNTSGWFLPTVHMLYSVNGRDKFTIGGTYYESDKEVHAIDKLFNDRLEIIKKYAKDDLIYKHSICDYLELAGSPTKHHYWGSNHYYLKNPISIMNIKVSNMDYCPKNGIKKNNYEVTSARAFLAF